MGAKFEDQIRYANNELLRGNLAVVEEVFAVTYTAHAGEKSYSGHPFIRQFITQLRASLSGLQVVEIQVLMHCDNKVAWQRTLSGVHEKNLHGIPPSGKKVKWTDLMVSRFEDEMIAEEWTVSELAGALMLKLPRR